jgi:hypothetical protein
VSESDHSLELQYVEGDVPRLGDCDPCGAPQRGQECRLMRTPQS